MFYMRVNQKYSVLKCSLIPITVITLAGCAKKDRIEISGTLLDPNQGISVSGAKVELWTRLIESGVFTANYHLEETQVSDKEGKFSFDLPVKNWTGIRLVFSKRGYYGWEYEVNMNQVNNYHAVTSDFQLLPKAWAKFLVKNNNPFDDSDYFEFRIMNGYTGCDICCHGEKYQFFGLAVQQDILCQLVGHQDVIIQMSTRKNGEQVFSTRSWFVPAFDTTEIELYY